MKTTVWCILAAFLVGAAKPAAGGTLIYRDENGSARIVSKVEIAGIADGQAEFAEKGGKDRASLPLTAILRFYGEDIKIEPGMLDDDSCDYTVQLSELERPEESARQGDNSCKVRFFVRRDHRPGRDGRIRCPYLYLTVLTEETKRDGSVERKRTLLAWPDAARISGRGEFSEAKVLEKLLAPGRQLWTPEDEVKLQAAPNTSLSGIEATFKLPGSNRRVIAYRLTAWSKYQLSDSASWSDSTAGVDDDWLTRDY